MTHEIIQERSQSVEFVAEPQLTALVLLSFTAYYNSYWESRTDRQFITRWL